MTSYTNIEIEIANYTAILWLNRPDRHNALNPDLMQEVIRFFEKVEDDSNVRFVVIRGLGKSFCAGADLNWMKNSAKLSPEENLNDSSLLTSFFSTIYQSSKVVIGIAHGNIFGGGNGLLAACDIVYGITDSRFSLSETRLGLIAATITPYMLNKLHTSTYKELIFTARPFDGNEAERIGLLNKCFEAMDQLDEHLTALLELMLKAGPQSLIGSKRLINDLNNPAKFAEIVQQIPQILANVRVTDEAKEGFVAFLEKRKPKW
ncbi:MAG: enoyl-CoA hydratase-related protein [Prolixibacteraceae bacterium]